MISKKEAFNASFFYHIIQEEMKGGVPIKQ